MSRIVRNRGHHTLMLATVFGLLAGALLICQAALAAGDAQCDGQATGRKFGPQGQVLAWVNGSFHCTASSCNNPAEPCAVQQLPGAQGQSSTKNADCTMTVTTKMECRCPSGAGSAGCSEVWMVTVTYDRFGVPGEPVSKMYCQGPCPEGQECALHKRDTHGNRDCRCQG